MKTLNIKGKPYYSTDYGRAYLADSLKFTRDLADNKIDLIFTSPPYALHFKKEYGNKSQDEYVDWFLEFGKEFLRVLKPTGSMVIDIGGSWQQGQPTRSLYHFELLLRLCKEVGFYLAQECYWYNPAKLPAPAEWVTVQRIRIKDSVNCLWWLSKTQNPKATNLNVLAPYSPDMLRLLKRGYKAKLRPSGHNITSGFQENHGGSIPSNLLIYGNNDSNSHYLEECKKNGIKPHPARFPIQLPTFFLRMLTDQDDLIYDPFAGSNTTGEACEREKRKWLSVEIEEQYVKASKYRFEKDELKPVDLNKSNKKPAEEQTVLRVF